MTGGPKPTEKSRVRWRDARLVRMAVEPDEEAPDNAPAVFVYHTLSNERHTHMTERQNDPETLLYPLSHLPALSLLWRHAPNYVSVSELPLAPRERQEMLGELWTAGLLECE